MLSQPIFPQQQQQYQQPTFQQQIFPQQQQYQQQCLQQQRVAPTASPSEERLALEDMVTGLRSRVMMNTSDSNAIVLLNQYEARLRRFSM